MEISKAAVIEFFLFASPKPITVSQLKDMIGDMDTEEIKEAIKWLQKNFYHPGRALQIYEVAEGYQICTRPEFYPWLQRLSHYQIRRRLTKAALEVLAIVTYRQPITRNEVEQIRGVSSGFLLRNLLQQKLIQIVGRKECPGRPILYGTGKEFMDYFGLRDLKDLPKEAELKELVSNEETEGISDQS